jgi:predicted nuclease with TOPRIM domain
LKLREKLTERRDALKAEFDKGNARLQAIETEADKLRETLLRISGAIQVLTEELGDGAETGLAEPDAANSGAGDAP